MTPNTIIEASGSISKEVNLCSLNENIIPGTCVLEALELYPGYYGDDPVVSSPYSLFFILKEHYTKEKIIRATNEIKKYFGHDFQASPGEISLYNNQCRLIRINGLENYDYIEELQKCYIDAGLMLKKQKINVNDKGIIKVGKEFLLHEFEEGFYQDEIFPEKFYFKIPFKLNWKLFEKITTNIRTNWGGNIFDAAIGTLYRYKGLQDIVRVYSLDIKKEEIKILQEKYLHEIMRYYTV